MPIDSLCPLDAVHNAGSPLPLLQTSIGCGILILDDQLKVLSLNPLAKTFLPATTPHILHESIDLLPPPLAALIRETVDVGQPINGRHLVLPLEDSRETILQMSVAFLEQAAPGQPLIVVVLNDLSAIREWESGMRRLDRLHSVGTLAASRAHEVKNAFVAVRTFVDLLLEKNQHDDLAEIVRQEMERIDSILGQMLKFSRTARPAFAQISFHAVLDKSLLLIQHLLDEKRICLTRNFAASSDLITGDANQLEQAVINLCFNAVDALRHNGSLSITTDLLPAGSTLHGLTLDQNQPLLRIVIRDNGAGIPPQIAERLFEPFYTSKPEGTGLGLSITRRIIQDHHGVITMQSPPGQGATFTILLPASATIG